MKIELRGGPNDGEVLDRVGLSLGDTINVMPRFRPALLVEGIDEPIKHGAYRITSATTAYWLGWESDRQEPQRLGACVTRGARSLRAEADAMLAQEALIRGLQVDWRSITARSDVGPYRRTFTLIAHQPYDLEEL